MQKKKLLVLLTLTALALCSTGAFAQCTVAGSNGLAVIPQVVAVGSSAQVNTFAYAAAELITAAAGDTGINTADFNIATATKGVTINDTRISPTLSDSANPAFVIFDNKSTCNMYAYFTTDSGVGIKDFFATEKYTPVTGHTYDVTALTITFGTNSGGKVNQIPGLTDNYTWAGLPTAIVNFFAAPWLPTYSGTTLTNHPLAYCGSTASAPTTNGWCLFNMAATDIRPEDALYATTRALTTLVTTTYAGLGYNNPTCLAGAGTSTGSVTNTPELQGCPILDSFAQKKIFNVLSFKLSGTDPFTAATVPPYTTISMGAVPVVVFVGNYDTAGFGAPTGTTPYTINNVNRNVLSQVFQGDLHCTGDFLPSVTNNVGVPIQEVQREPLSGTYNTFEFNAVRTLTGSSNAAIGTASATSWASNDDRGTESGNNPITNFGSTDCGFSTATYTLSSGGLATAPDGTVECGDPVFISTGTTAVDCGKGLRARAIGTGEEIAATLALDGPTGGTTINDGVGYAFWGYGNFAAAATGCSGTTQNAYNSSCSFLGHYLTVDGIDPIYNTPGGANDTVPNPAGAYNPPQCNFASLPCNAIPFTHVKDGTYPIWTLLRDVTIPTNATDKTVIPAGVVALIAQAEYEASQNDRLSDFVPFLNVTNPSTGKGSLNLGVYHTHYKQTNSPVNGYAACAGNYSSITIGGGTGSCTVDAGGDVGGSVMTVQSDYDFNQDFGSLFLSGKYELYGQHQ